MPHLDTAKPSVIADSSSLPWIAIVFIAVPMFLFLIICGLLCRSGGIYPIGFAVFLAGSAVYGIYSGRSARRVFLIDHQRKTFCVEDYHFRELVARTEYDIVSVKEFRAVNVEGVRSPCVYAMMSDGEPIPLDTRQGAGNAYAEFLVARMNQELESIQRK